MNLAKLLLYLKKLTFKNFLLANVGDVPDKMIAILKISLIPGTCLFIYQSLTDWYIENQWFILLVLGVLVIDNIIGIITHWFFLKDFSTESFLKGLTKKIIVILSAYFVLEGLHNILSPVTFVEQYFSVMIQVFIFLYPGMSVLGNIYIISEGEFPPKGLMKRFKGFTDTGDLEVFKSSKSTEEQEEVG